MSNRKTWRLNAGRSIEEVMLLRKLSKVDGRNPDTWPELHTNILSSSLRVMDASSKPASAIINDSDLDKIKEDELESIKQYCSSLENRVKDLEIQLRMAALMIKKEMTQNTDTSRPALISQKKEFRTNSSVEVTNTRPSIETRAALRADVKSSLSHIDTNVLMLREIFRKGDPFSVRDKAATLIIASVRGFMARRRRAHYRTGIQNWKWSRCKTVVYALDSWLASQTRLDVGIRRMKLLRDMKKSLSIFNKWRYMSRQHAPMRRKIREKAEAMHLSMKVKLLKRVFLAFKEGCVGHQSQRLVREQRLQLLDSIRQDLLIKHRSSNGDEPFYVLEEDVKKLMYRVVVTSHLKKKQTDLKKRIFSELLDNLYRARSQLKQAADHWFVKRAGLCFYSWSDYIYLVGQGLQRKRWPGPRRYQVRYNQKKIEYFARIRILRFVWDPLKVYVQREMRGKRAFQKYAARFLIKVIRAWREVSIKDRAVRKEALDRWLGYSNVMTCKPFAALKSHMRKSKTRESENEAMVASYRRWKSRQKLYIIMRTWRHQALYGRVDGMYSRQMLVKSLQEQKQHSNAIAKIMATQAMELEECRALVQAETDKKEEIQEKLRMSYLECSRLRSIAHHAQQEQRRLEALVGSIALLNPRQLEHLKRLQPNFNFKERKVLERIYESENASDEAEIQANTNDVTTTLTESQQSVDVRSMALTAANADLLNVDVKAVNISDSQGVPECSQSHPILSKDDAVLLDRVKWLLSRFADNTFNVPASKSEGSNMQVNNELFKSFNNSGTPVIPSVAMMPKAVTSASSTEDEIFVPTSDPRAVVSITNNHEPTTVKVCIYGADRMARENPAISAAFSASVTAATAVVLGAISSTIATEKSLIASDFLGAGSEYVAAKMLIGVLDFLQHGDVSVFSPVDRVSWTQHVFQEGVIEVEENATEENKLSDLSIVGHIVQNALCVVSPTKCDTQTADAWRAKPAPLWNNSVDAAAETVLSNDFTWRAALLGLRALHPNSSSYNSINSIETQIRNSIDGPQLSDDSDRNSAPDKSNMPLRLLQMKERMAAVMHQHQQRHAKHLQTITEQGLNDTGLKLEGTDLHDFVKEYMETAGRDPHFQISDISRATEERMRSVIQAKRERVEEEMQRQNS